MKGLFGKSVLLPRLLAALCTISLAVTQPGNKRYDTKPEPSTYIERYYVAGAAPDSTYDTGPLHIVYSDGTVVIQDLPPKTRSTENHIVSNPEGFSDVQLAEDRQTLGWTETYDNCGTSYAVPLVVVLYRSGKVLARIQTGQMVWSWTFSKHGNRAAVVWGPTHGPEVGDFKLYDVRMGKVLAEVYGDPQTQALKADAPSWAKKLEARLNGIDPANDRRFVRH
jgi:hypothetical protein